MSKNLFKDLAGALLLFAIFVGCMGVGLIAIDRVAAQQEMIYAHR